MKRLSLLLLLLLVAVPVVAGVNVASSGLTHRQPLFAAQGGPLPLVVLLTYDSLHPLGSDLSFGWSHSYDIYLHANSDGTMVLVGGAGTRFYYPYGPGGSGYQDNIVDGSFLAKMADSSWVIFLRGGGKYIFGADKKLQSIVDRFGNTVTLNNTVAGQTTVIDPSGRSAIIHRDLTGKIDWIKDPAQQQYDFSYDASGQLQQLQYPAPTAGAGRPTWSYLYAAGRLAYVTDPEMHISKYQYDGGGGRVTRSVDPEGVVDTSGAETADVAYHSKSLTYGVARGVAEVNAITVTEKDLGQWVYRYAANGALISKEAPDFKRIDYNYYSNDTFSGRLKETITPVDTATVHVVRTESYDSNGNPTVVKSLTRVIATGAETLDQHLVYTYGSYDRLTSVSDLIAGTITTIAYDTVAGEETVTLTAPKINAADANGPQTVMLYDIKGQIKSITDPLGRHFAFGYGTTGLLETISDAASGIVATYSTFDAFGRAKTVTVSKSGQPDRVVQLDYDALGRTKSVTQPGVVLSEGAAPVALLTSFGYDLLGNRTAVTDAENQTTTFDYNYRGQVDKITDALTQVTELLYSGAGCATCGGGVDKLVGVKDAKGQQTDFTYDATGQLTSEIAPGDAASRRILYVYTDAGQLKEKRRDADGDGLVGSGDQLVLSFVYTPDGKLASKTDHLGGTSTTTYGYNAQGRLQSASNAAASYESTAGSRASPAAPAPSSMSTMPPGGASWRRSRTGRRWCIASTTSTTPRPKS